VLGTSLQYRRALERLIGAEPKTGAGRRRVKALRKLLHCTCAKYNLAKRHSPLVALPLD